LNPLTDRLNIASRLTPRRLANSAGVLGSYLQSRMSGIARHRGMPISIGIEPTTSCNLRCPECPSGLRSFTRPTGMLEETMFKRLIDELKETLSYITFYFQGEPYLHPKFLSLVKYASQQNIYTATSTNAHYLSDKQARDTVESGLDRLILSLDGTDQETYEQYRVGGNIDKVLEGARNVLKWRKELRSKTPYVVFQFLVVKPNEHQVPAVQKLAKEIGVDNVLLKTAQIYDYKNGSELMPTIEKYSRYKKAQDGTWSIKNQLLNHCWKMWNSCVVTWDGKVVPCCFDKDAHYTLGDLKTNTFEEIWRSDMYNEFRRSILRSREEIGICRNCTEGTKVFA
jgi:radical SAM protein with 4Fe4S-binding SPASM domain